MTTSLQESMGVRVTYSPEHWVTPEFDYCQLLSHMSLPNNSGALFHSKVGIARIALLGCGLGGVFGFHLLLFVLHPTNPLLASWSLYAMAMCIYHFLEFLTTAINHPGAANSDSFLLNHSKSFAAALVASWMEFWLGAWMFPQTKFALPEVQLIGLGMVIGGQLARTTAMYQAGPSFTHMIAYEKHPRHQLVTTGIYSLLRHPAYFGWFYWSIGTQLVLGNPVCFVVYWGVAWNFFRIRLADEEEALVEMFGSEYVQYQARSYIGIPFI
ncbi:hypothetical protein BASA81_005847 [Batrachochytrium salamandrivorans]|nr:hypothetical protein BASA81_005847 [Batrachochytrium salamandrivorans]